MKFLDLNGLTHFFGKVKTWAGNNYLSLKGGTITGYVYFEKGAGILAKKTDESVEIGLTSSALSAAAKGENGRLKNTFTLEAATGNVLCGELTASKFVKTNGTATQVLIADGSVKGIGSANGVAGLDSNGYVPLAQLGNLDTTVAEVVSALPTTNIKKHIYLIKDTDGVTQNQYEEYLYTGNTSAAYDASKWEKLGDFRATVDLADYAKKKEAMHSMDVYPTATDIQISLKGVNDFPLGFIAINAVTSQSAGVMIPSDKTKLDGIANNANNYSLPTASSTTKGGITLGYSQSGKNYPVVLDGNGKAYVNVPWTDTNTTYDLSPYAKTADVNAALAKKVDVVSGKGLSTHDFTSAYKSKLDGISSGATADSAITTAEIDALFT